MRVEATKSFATQIFDLITHQPLSPITFRPGESVSILKATKQPGDKICVVSAKTGNYFDVPKNCVRIFQS